jgi:hypothetical protein
MFFLIALPRGVTDLAAAGAGLLLAAAGAVALSQAGAFADPSPRARRVPRLAPPPVLRTRRGRIDPADDADVWPHLPFVVLRVDPADLERMAAGRIGTLEWYADRGDTAGAPARFALLPWLFTPPKQRPTRAEDGRWSFPGTGRSPARGSRGAASTRSDAPRDTYRDTGYSGPSDSSSHDGGGFGGGGGDSW